MLLVRDRGYKTQLHEILAQILNSRASLNDLMEWRTRLGLPLYYNCVNDPVTTMEYLICIMSNNAFNVNFSIILVASSCFCIQYLPKNTKMRFLNELAKCMPQHAVPEEPDQVSTFVMFFDKGGAALVPDNCKIKILNKIVNHHQKTIASSPKLIAPIIQQSPETLAPILYESLEKKRTLSAADLFLLGQINSRTFLPKPKSKRLIQCLCNLCFEILMSNSNYNININVPQKESNFIQKESISKGKNSNSSEGESIYIEKEDSFNEKNANFNDNETCFTNLKNKKIYFKEGSQHNNLGESIFNKCQQNIVETANNINEEKKDDNKSVDINQEMSKVPKLNRQNQSIQDDLDTSDVKSSFYEIESALYCTNLLISWDSYSQISGFYSTCNFLDGIESKSLRALAINGFTEKVKREGFRELPFFEPSEDPIIQTAYLKLIVACLKRADYTLEMYSHHNFYEEKANKFEEKEECIAFLNECLTNNMKNEDIDFDLILESNIRSQEINENYSTNKINQTKKESPNPDKYLGVNETENININQKQNINHDHNINQNQNINHNRNVNQNQNRIGNDEKIMLNENEINSSIDNTEGIIPITKESIELWDSINCNSTSFTSSSDIFSNPPISCDDYYTSSMKELEKKIPHWLLRSIVCEFYSKESPESYILDSPSLYDLSIEDLELMAEISEFLPLWVYLHVLRINTKQIMLAKSCIHIIGKAPKFVLLMLFKDFLHFLDHMMVINPVDTIVDDLSHLFEIVIPLLPENNLMELAFYLAKNIDFFSFDNLNCVQVRLHLLSIITNFTDEELPFFCVLNILIEATESFFNFDFFPLSPKFLFSLLIFFSSVPNLSRKLEKERQMYLIFLSMSVVFASFKEDLPFISPTKTLIKFFKDSKKFFSVIASDVVADPAFSIKNSYPPLSAALILLSKLKVYNLVDYVNKELLMSISLADIKMIDEYLLECLIDGLALCPTETSLAAKILIHENEASLQNSNTEKLNLFIEKANDLLKKCSISSFSASISILTHTDTPNIISFDKNDDLRLLLRFRNEFAPILLCQYPEHRYLLFEKNVKQNYHFDKNIFIQCGIYFNTHISLYNKDFSGFYSSDVTFDLSNLNNNNLPIINNENLKKENINEKFINDNENFNENVDVNSKNSSDDKVNDRINDDSKNSYEKTKFSSFNGNNSYNSNLFSANIKTKEIDVTTRRIFDFYELEQPPLERKDNWICYEFNERESNFFKYNREKYISTILNLPQNLLLIETVEETFNKFRIRYPQSHTGNLYKDVYQMIKKYRKRNECKSFLHVFVLHKFEEIQTHNELKLWLIQFSSPLILKFQPNSKEFDSRNSFSNSIFGDENIEAVLIRRDDPTILSLEENNQRKDEIDDESIILLEKVRKNPEIAKEISFSLHFLMNQKQNNTFFSNFSFDIPSFNIRILRNMRNFLANINDKKSKNEADFERKIKKITKNIDTKAILNFFGNIDLRNPILSKEMGETLRFMESVDLNLVSSRSLQNIFISNLFMKNKLLSNAAFYDNLIEICFFSENLDRKAKKMLSNFFDESKRKNVDVSKMQILSMFQTNQD